MNQKENKSRGKVTVGVGGDAPREVEIKDFIQARYKGNRLITIATLEDESVSVSVENPVSSGRAPQQGLWLSEESFVALLSSAFLYYSCKGQDMGQILMKAVEQNKDTVDFSMSDNLSSPFK